MLNSASFITSTPAAGGVLTNQCPPGTDAAHWMHPVRNDATTRAAKDYGFDCTVIGDACATKDLTALDSQVSAAGAQTAFLAGLSYFYATVQNSTDYLA